MSAVAWSDGGVAARGLLLLLLVFLGGAALTDPRPLDVPEGLDSKAVYQAIAEAMAWRGWRSEDSRDKALKQGSLLAQLRIRQHLIRVRIEFDARRVRISYQGSDNMSYREREGFRFINKHYMQWTDILRREIERRLNGGWV